MAALENAFSNAAIAKGFKLPGVYGTLEAKADSFQIKKREVDNKIVCFANVTYKDKEYRSKDRTPTVRQFKRNAVRACLTKTSAKELLQKLK